MTPCSGGGHVARCDALSEPLDDRGFAHARFAGQDRIVLPPAHQNVDDLPDFVLAAEDGVHLAGLGSGGQILAEPIERRRAFGAERGGRAVRARRGDARPVHRAQVALVGPGPDRALAGGDFIDGKLGEFL